MQDMSGILREVRLASIGMADTLNPMLALRFNNVPVAGEVPTLQRTRATITVDKTGGGSSKMRLTIALYSIAETGAAGATTSYIFDGITGGSGTVTAVTATLGELITQLNKIAGITAYRMNAAADYPLNTDDLINVAETDISTIKFTETLYRDVSEIYYSAYRLGIPQFMDGGRIKLLGISGTVTGATAGTVKISKDPSETDATKEELVQSFAMVNTNETKYWDFNDLEAPVLKGPLLIELASTDLSAANIAIRYVSVNA